MKKLLLALFCITVLTAQAFPFHAPAKAPAFQQAFK